MLRSVALPEHLATGRLYLCSMPGRFEALDVFRQEVLLAIKSVHTRSFFSHQFHFGKWPGRYVESSLDR